MKKILTLTAYLTTSALIFAQDLNLDAPAQKLMEQIAKIFPYVAGFFLLFVIFKNLNHFTSDEGEPLKGIKNVGIYCLVVVAMIAIYKWVTSQTI